MASRDRTMYHLGNIDETSGRNEGAHTTMAAAPSQRTTRPDDDSEPLDQLRLRLRYVACGLITTFGAGWTLSADVMTRFHALHVGLASMAAGIVGYVALRCRLCRRLLRAFGKNRGQQPFRQREPL